ncbi:MAG: glycoside hydrolase family 88 protein [Treponema sp.]|nr:glycoside hydrolase family 88 protein [Treponema sp.]
MKLLSERMARMIMRHYTPEQVRWHYEHGLVLQSIYAVGERTGNAEYCSWVKSMYDTMIRDDGSIAAYKSDEYNLDQINAGKMLFTLYKTSGEQKYRIAIETLRQQLRAQSRTKSGGFWHKKIYPYQMWLDGLYMAAPFYAQYVAMSGAVNDFADITHQFMLMVEKARDPATGLLYHAWNEDNKQTWANPDTGCSPHFWGRAMGWYCMAIVDVLDFIPQTRVEERKALITIAEGLVPPLLACQDPSGLWYQVLDQGARTGNYLESSATAMFTYFLLKMLRKGYLAADAREAARSAAFAAYQGLLMTAVKDDADGDPHLHGVCSVAGLGGQPYRDGSFAYYVGEPVCVDDFKGVGALILAALEQECAA